MSTTVTRHLLPGLRPEPLASYLAGLGLIRVIGEQADPHATAAWRPGGLAITTQLTDIPQWLADEYRPTPVLSPWNGGSGFGAKDKEPLRRLDRLQASASPRLAPLNAAIGVAQVVTAKARDRGWITDGGIADKAAVVTELRNTCPDELLPWIDAAIVLTDQKAFFPPILGTGGNDGHLDFSTNYHQQVLDLLGGDSDTERMRAYASACDLLAGTQQTGLAVVKIGQFDPGSAGGPGSSRTGAAASLSNPWSYVLSVEGAALFAASAARRNQHGAGNAAMPFTVDSSPDGSGSGADGEISRGELWAPLWRADFSLDEIRQVFAEARASWRGRPARRVVDFYAATRSLGVARGIDAFTRYGLHQRNGQAHTAVPLDHVIVSERPAVRLSAVVEDWVAQADSGNASAAVSTAHRAFRKEHLAFARDGDAPALARMLAALTGLEVAVGRSGRAKSGVPVRYASNAADFLPVLRDIDEPEFRVAVGIASCATRPAEAPPRTMRHLLLPIDPAERGKPGRWRDAPLITGFGVRPLAAVLADVLVWRSRTASTDRGAAAFRGVPGFQSGVPVPAADLHKFTAGELDDSEVAHYLRACLALNWRDVQRPWAPAKPAIPVSTLALLQPLAAGLSLGNAHGATDKKLSALSPQWAARLATALPGQVRLVHDEAAALLRQAAGWTVPTAPPPEAVPPGDRVAAALVPRSLSATAVLRMVALPPQIEAEAAQQPVARSSDPEFSEEF